MNRKLSSDLSNSRDVNRPRKMLIMSSSSEDSNSENSPAVRKREKKVIRRTRRLLRTPHVELNPAVIPPDVMLERAPWTAFYDEREEIGSGGGGTVHAATRKSDGKAVALKFIPKFNVPQWVQFSGCMVPIEFELLHKASVSKHPGIIGMIEWFDEKDEFVLVMERPNRAVDIRQSQRDCGEFSEDTARSVFHQVALAVLHCHESGVVHRDIKPENVLLDPRTFAPKLIDFGCGAMLQTPREHHYSGTLMYYPPEWYTEHSYHGPRLDLWGLGVLLYIIVEGTDPFESPEDIMRCDLRHRRGYDMSDAYMDLITGMLCKDEKSRLTIDEIINHPWIHEY